jgi:hypothetical protein
MNINAALFASLQGMMGVDSLTSKYAKLLDSRQKIAQ